MKTIDYHGDPRAVLCHFNKNHDPNTGRFTSSSASGLASSVYKNASARIEVISDDVITAAERSGSKMYGLEHRQKTKDSIARKIRKNASENNISFEEAAGDIKDAVRFTTVSSEKDFVNNYNEFKRILANDGYSEVRCKNYFQLFREGKVKHKSVQSVFSTDDGYRFEVQFQTPSSQEAKDKKLPLYEEARSIDVSPDRKRQLEAQMKQLADNVRDPDGIERIKTH